MNCLKRSFLFGLVCALSVVPFASGTLSANDNTDNDESSIQAGELAHRGWGGHGGGWGGGYGYGRGWGGGYGGYGGYSSSYYRPYSYSYYPYSSYSYYPYNYYSPYYYGSYGW